MGGNGVAGVIIGALRIITKAAMHSDDSLEISSLIYFGVTGGILLICTLSFAFILRHPFVKSYTTVVDHVRQTERSPLMSIDNSSLVKNIPTVSYSVLLQKLWIEYTQVFTG